MIEYKEAYACQGFLARDLTEHARNGWELVCILGPPHIKQIGMNSAVPNVVDFLLRRESEQQSEP